MPNITLVDASNRSAHKISTSNEGDAFGLLFHDESDALEYASHLDDAVNWVPHEIGADLASWAEQLHEQHQITGIYESIGDGMSRTIPLTTFTLYHRTPWNPNP